MPHLSARGAPIPTTGDAGMESITPEEHFARTGLQATGRVALRAGMDRADRVANPSSVAKTLLRADSCPMPGHEQKHDHLAVYLSTVGQKPSKADFYLDDTDDVLELLGNLTAAAP